MRLISWNVNGIRAVSKKGFLEWLDKESPDVMCLQETKAMPEQLDASLLNPMGYTGYFNSAQRKGYSGVATFCLKKPTSVQNGIGVERFDAEGRVLMTDHGDFILFNIYFPNGKMNAERLQYKMDFYDTVLKYFDALKDQGKKLVICGDYNTAHKPIDLARPRENEKISGFLPSERAWMDELVSHGYVDTLRVFNQEPGQYSWWDQQSRARERNVGWRIDYFFVSDNLLPALKNAWIMPDVMGSDHCPVGIELKF
ncbi:exodeoxyribonuclease III [bacterium]|nr:exodeoxyribonuclease III [bacterium]NUN46713.1 exodeoxyribonuclease III [bacterium]HMW34064.1 exodeoxyribonuclease III [bacterium]HMW37027.1 exodeoxyribonuclease III [bacterium]HMZ04826.1 exodeoxyribonuclease III [bacterium]